MEGLDSCRFQGTQDVLKESVIELVIKLIRNSSFLLSSFRPRNTLLALRRP